MIAKDTEALDKIKEYSERGKDAINDFVKEKITDEDGNELEFVDKMLLKLHELKEELDAKIAEGVETAYEKMRIAHTNDIKALNEKVDALTKELSLAQSRLDALEAK
jgi:polyhydroxyalkanoate synthesis regulator phasin